MEPMLLGFFILIIWFILYGTFRGLNTEEARKMKAERREAEREEAKRMNELLKAEDAGRREKLDKNKVEQEKISDSKGHGQSSPLSALKKTDSQAHVSKVKKITPLKFTKAAALAQRVTKSADVQSIIQYAHLMNSDAERKEVVVEVNEELKSLYLDELYAELDIKIEDRDHYRQIRSFSIELERCMELGIRQILSDERLVELLGLDASNLRLNG